MTLKAIETRYNGYLFRSRLEARWAVFFDALGLGYEYEHQGFDLHGRAYLPDFWLPALDCWAEVKPTTPTEEEVDLCEDLALATDRTVLCLIGTPPGVIWFYCFDCTDGSAGTQWWKDGEGSCLRVNSHGRTVPGTGPHWTLDTRGKPCICSANDWSSRTFSSPQCDGPPPSIYTVRNCLHEGNVWSGAIWKAIKAARSARFEHGQTPR